jgi:hypothetical protein
MILQLRHFLRCERMQRRNQIHTMGSQPPSDAAQHLVKLGFGWQRERP